MMEDKPRWKRYAEAVEDELPELLPNSDQDFRASSAPEASNLLAQRAFVPMALFVLILAAVIVRSIHWQLSAAAAPDTTAQAAAAVNPDPARGRILDRNGLLMATDTFVGQVYADPTAIQANTRRGYTAVLSTTLTLGMTPEAMQTALSAGGTSVLLTKTATVAQCEAINNFVMDRLNMLNMVWCDFTRQRSYPQGAVAAHLLGFENSEHKGLYGLEASYDSWLNSDLQWPGAVPADTQPMPADWKLYLPSLAGRDLVLNLDVPLQYMVERRLNDAIAKYHAEAGTIIIMDPRTGAVLAMANAPSYDPGHFSDVDPNTWVNSAISEIYEPGSVFKLVTMSSGIDSGYITPDTPFYDEGVLEVAGRKIQNAERAAYGNVTVREALAKSINVVSAKVSAKMGKDVFYSYVKRFGFGNMTEVDLGAEVTGIVKQPGSSDWSPADLATNSFGQGISVTPFQMINAVSAIANHGQLLQPEVAKALVSNGVVHPIPPRVMGQPITAATAKAVTEMMVYTVASSSTSDPVPGYKVAGKTGTAEIPTKEGYTSLESIMSFIGFLPAADPQLVIMVELVKPKVGTWAEQVAVPVWSQVGQDAVKILEIKPDDRDPS